MRSRKFRPYKSRWLMLGVSLFLFHVNITASHLLNETDVEVFSLEEDYLTEDEAILPPPLIQPGDSVIYTDGNCLAAMPDFTVLYGILVFQNIPAGTMLRRGRYFVRITTVIGLINLGYRVVTVVDGSPPVFSLLSNQNVNVASNACSQIVNYSGSVSDNCAMLAPSSISGYTLIGDHNGHRYFRSNSAYNWYDANNLAFSIGGYLTTINNNAERAFLEGQGQCWIGLNEINNVGANNFTWINGESSSYSYWLSGRPILNADPSGVVINNSPNNRWGDWPATDSYRFIVEFPIAVEEQLSVTRTAGLASGSSFPVGNTTVTFLATDESGNSSNSSFNINVTDNIAPAITCASTINGNTSSANCSGAVNVPNPTLSDNCGVVTMQWQLSGATTGASPLTGINYLGSYNFNLGQTTILYTVFDAAGNSATCTSIVQVADNVPPVISNCPNNLTLATTSSCNAVIPNYLSSIVATDNCSAVTMSQTPGAGNTISGTTTVMITVSDAAGNQSVCNFQVVVVDTIAPTIYWAPGNQTLAVGSNCSAILADYAAQGSYGDNCSGAITRTQTPDAGTVISSNTNVIITITDAAGNSTNHALTVTLNDNILPTVTCSSIVNTNVDAAACNKSVVVTNATYSDNCSVASLRWVMTGVTTGASPITGINQVGTQTFNVGLTTVTYTATDVNGNIGTCSFTVNVQDNILPSVNCSLPINTTVAVGTCNKSVVVTNATYSDNCSVASLRWAMTGVTTGASPVTGINQVGTQTFNVGLTTVTYTATDVNGNVGTCSFTVNVDDNILPSVNCSLPINTTVAVGACNESVVVTNATYSDNCSVASLRWAMTGVTTGASPVTGINQVGTQTFNVGLTTVTYTATDVNGNVGTCSFIVNVQDNILPEITCPSGGTYPATAGTCGKVLSFTTPVATDNCAIASITNSLNNTNSISNYTFPIGTTNIVWTALDIHNNSLSCTQTIVVTDGQAPLIMTPLAINQSADLGSCTKNLSVSAPTVLDNCGNITISNNITGTNPIINQPFNVGSTIITWTATDAANNVSTATQIVHITDTQLPVVSCPSNVITSTELGTCGKYITINPPSATDNCGVQSITNNSIYASSTTNASGTYPKGTYIFNWTITDTHDNTVICSQTIKVNDNENPQISSVEQITVNTTATSCDVYVNIPQPIFSDNCPGITITNDYPYAASNTDASGTYPLGTTIITWTATDASDNISSDQTIVIVTDNVSPVITNCPEDQSIALSIDCDYLIPDFVSQGLVTATDNCTTSLVITQYPLAGSLVSGSSTITITVEDESENESTCSFVLTPIDTTAPTILCPADTFYLSLNASCMAFLPDYTNFITATDNCTNPYELEIMQFPPPGITITSNTVVDFTAFDSELNYSEPCSVLVVVLDEMPPIITCQDDISIFTEPDMLNATVTLSLPEAEDNCSPTFTFWNNYTNSDLTTDVFPIGEHTVEWTVTDLAGNEAQCSVQVNVISGDLPVINCEPEVQYYSSSTSCGVEVLIETPTATDINGIVELNHNYPSNIIYLPVGEHEIIWTAIDGLGNIGNCTTAIYVIDSIAPFVDCVELIEIETDLGETFGTVSVDWPEVTESCDYSFISPTAIPSSQFEIGSHTIEWIVEDESGNTGSCTTTVVVTDITPPQINCIEEITFPTGIDSCSKWISLPAPQVLNNEGNIEITNLTNGTNDASGVYSAGTHQIEWVFTDVNGNVQTCVQTFTIEDNQPPLVLCGPELIFYTSGNNCSAEVYIGTPVVIDNCDTAPIVISSEENADFYLDSLTVGSWTITWIAIDDYSNSGHCLTNILVVDTTGYIFNCPENQSVVLYPDEQFILEDYTLSLPQFDECGSPISYTQLPGAGEQINVSTTITITAIDGRLNESHCSFEITIMPYDVPVVSECPSDSIVMYLSQACQAAFPDITAWLNSSNVVFEGNYTVIQSPAAGTVYSEQTELSIWVVDEYGYSTTPCIIPFEVIDNQAPVFTPVNTENHIMTCDHNYVNIPSIQDCNTESTVWLISGNNPLQVGMNEMTYKASDGTNESTYTFTIELVEMPEVLWDDVPSTLCLNDNPITFEVETTADYYFLVNGNQLSGNTFDPSVFGAGEFSIKLMASYSACSSMKHQSITVFDLPNVSIENSVYKTCDGEIELSVNSNATSIEWTTEAENVSITNPNANATSVLSADYGSYTVSVSGTLNGCANNDSAILYFYEQPLKPNAGPDQVIHLTNELVMNGEYIGVGQTSWSVLSGNATFTDIHDLLTSVHDVQLGDNLYLLTVQNEICTASDTVLVNVNGLFIPTGFSPNGDGVNDSFEIRGIQNLAKAELYIINRWGQAVYTSEDYGNEWIGFNDSNIELPDDTYFYELVLDTENHKGYVVIKR